MMPEGLMEGRAEAEARMGAENGGSTVTVHRPTDDTVLDEDTGAEVPNWTTPYTDHPFRLGGSHQGDGGSRTLTTGGVEVTLATRTGHFSAATSDLREGDLIEVTAGENEGLVLRVVEATWQDQATARRVPVVESKRPSEWG